MKLNVGNTSYIQVIKRVIQIFPIMLLLIIIATSCINITRQFQPKEHIDNNTFSIDELTYIIVNNNEVQVFDCNDSGCFDE